MAAPALGTRAGTMHIRVLPNTKEFPRELKNKLKVIEEKTHFTVNVDRAKVYRAKLKASIKKQLEDMDNFSINVNAKANVKEVTREIEKLTEAKKFKLSPELDQIMLQRLRSDINKSMRDIEPMLSLDVDDDEARWKLERLSREFDKLGRDMDLGILPPEEMARIRHKLRDLKDEIEETTKDRTVRLDFNPFTMWATARINWLTRPRIVAIIPQVSRAALAKAVTALAALSGGRLSFDYLRRFSDWISEIDKKLPKLTFGVLGLTTLFAGLMGSISGIVGLGEGLAATLPSLLLLPGLLMGAAMSGVTLFVAMKDAKDELAELGDSYTNLGKIIKKSFWKEARQPIIDLSNSVMPQLERSFDKTAAAIGRFTAQLSGSFQREFANGRLEKMFDGLAASWDELAKGADGFAGAITNLGLVAARYMPRLARWFVRQADTFDNWLSDVATDGRLDQWMEEAIDSFYALWDVMAATTGIFQGLWWAAEAGGSTGLRGFADMLLRWEKAVQGQKWQETLTAMFRGARVALQGFGDGLERFGNMLHTQRGAIEYFVGTAGTALGDFIGNLSDAFARPKVAQGMRDFVDGIKGALEALAPALPALADAFGTLIGFVGKPAEHIAPVLARTFEVLAPLLEDVLNALEPLIPVLGEALVEVIERLAPHIETLTEKFIELLPEIIDFVAGIIKRLPELALVGGIIAGIAGAIGSLVGFATKAYGAIKPLWDALGGKKGVGAVLGALGGKILKFGGPIGFVIGLFIDMLTNSESLREGFKKLFTGIGDLARGLWDFGNTIADLFGSGGKFAVVGEALGKMWEGIRLPLDQLAAVLGGGFGAGGELLSALGKLLSGDYDGAFEHLKAAGTELSDMVSELVDNFLKVTFPPEVLKGFEDFKADLDLFFADPETWLQEKGEAIVDGLKLGLVIGIAKVQVWFLELPGRVMEWMRDGWEGMVLKGEEIIDGLKLGLVIGWAKTQIWFQQLPGNIINFFIGSAEWLITQGILTVQGFLNGVVQKYEGVKAWFRAIPGNIKAFFVGAQAWLQTEGQSALQGFLTGLSIKWGQIKGWFRGIPGQVLSFFAGAGSWLWSSGVALLDGFAAGVESAAITAYARVAVAVARIRGLFPNSPAKSGPFSGSGWVSYSGESVGDTFGNSAVDSLTRSKKRISKSLSGIRSEFTSLSGDVDSMSPSFDVSGQFSSARAYSARASELVGAPAGARQSSVPTAANASTNNHFTFVNPVVRDDFQDAWDEANGGI